MPLSKLRPACRCMQALMTAASTSGACTPPPCRDSDLKCSSWGAPPRRLLRVRMLPPQVLRVPPGDARSRRQGPGWPGAVPAGRAPAVLGARARLPAGDGAPPGEARPPAGAHGRPTQHPSASSRLSRTHVQDCCLPAGCHLSLWLMRNQVMRARTCGDTGGGRAVPPV